MLPNARERLALDHGFTLIELLVVILIIGVLAAIAIPSFLNQTGKAHDTGAKVVARTAETAEETVYTDGQGYATQAVGASATGPLNAVERTLIAASVPCSGAPPYTANPCGLSVSATSSTYNLSVTSKTGIVYRIARDAAGQVTRTCDVQNAVHDNGGCANVVGHIGTW
jgi:type IV pilus assembly protein PilA